jgi:ABC-type cobalt transport system substrate-binding protein
MKIRMRLTLWYIGVSSLILLTFSLGTYFGMQRLLFRALDQELNSLIESIERNYDPFFEHFLPWPSGLTWMSRFLPSLKKSPIPAK